jgi:hypothetical protein
VEAGQHEDGGNRPLLDNFQRACGELLVASGYRYDDSVAVDLGILEAANSLGVITVAYDTTVKSDAGTVDSIEVVDETTRRSGMPDLRIDAVTIDYEFDGDDLQGRLFSKVLGLGREIRRNFGCGRSFAVHDYT